MKAQVSSIAGENITVEVTKDDEQRQFVVLDAVRFAYGDFHAVLAGRAVGITSVVDQSTRAQAVHVIGDVAWLRSGESLRGFGVADLTKLFVALETFSVKKAGKGNSVQDLEKGFRLGATSLDASEVGLSAELKDSAGGILYASEGKTDKTSFLSWARGTSSASLAVDGESFALEDKGIEMILRDGRGNSFAVSTGQFQRMIRDATA